MKNNELNLDLLENADDNTVKRLSAEYSAVMDKDVSRLYARAEKLYDSRKNELSYEPQDTVSGVEIY